MQLEDKLALVTGASSGIGAATACLLAERGARLILVARNAPRLDAVARRIATSGGEADVIAADLSDIQQVKQLGEHVKARFGAPDVLINNAGAGRWQSVLETSPEEALSMLAVPYLAAFTLTRELLPAMLERGSGHIVNVTSVAARLAWPGATAYIAARRAMDGFHAGLAAELLGTGVGCSLMVLGTVETPYWEHNPGSRERLPRARGIAPLEVDEAASAIAVAIERERPRVVKPAVFRLLFVLAELFPESMKRMLSARTPAGTGER